MMKQIILGLFFLVLSSNILSSDRLERLSETLSNPTYSSSDLLESNVMNVALRSDDEWYFSECKKDRFEGDKQCSMSKSGIVVLILNGKTFIMIGGEHFPRSHSAIRIDNNKTEYGIEGIFGNNNRILNQMLRGNVLDFRFVEWPRNYNVDNSIELKGFTDAYHNLKTKYQVLK